MSPVCHFSFSLIFVIPAKAKNFQFSIPFTFYFSSVSIFRAFCACDNRLDKQYPANALVDARKIQSKLIGLFARYRALDRLCEIAVIVRERLEKRLRMSERQPRPAPSRVYAYVAVAV
jgi:hypothetical protein